LITSAFGFRYYVGLDVAGPFSFMMPATDTKGALLAEKASVVRCYVDGAVVFLGLVESLEDVRAGEDRALVVRGRSLLSVFSEVSVGNVEVSGKIGPVLTDPDYWSVIYKPAGSWITFSVSGDITSEAIHGQFRGESSLMAWVKMAENVGDHFVYLPQVDGDKAVRWLAQNYDDSGVRAVQGGGPGSVSNANICLIESLTRTRDGAGMYNRVFAYGYGNAGAQLDISATTATTDATFSISTAQNSIVHSDSQSTYGYIDKTLTFSDIRPVSNTDADVVDATDYLVVAAKAALLRNAYPKISYTMDVTHLPAAAWPGTTIDVTFQDDSLTLSNETMVISGIDAELDDETGEMAYSLTLSELGQPVPSSAGEVVGSMEQGEMYIAHPQAALNVWAVSYSGDSFDDAITANLFFPLTSAITRVQQVLFYYRVDPLRSTVKSITGGASTLSTTDNSNPSHGHAITMADNGGTPYGQFVFYQAGGGGWNINGGASAGVDSVNLNHTHGMDHTHTSTGTYGPFEDTGNDPAEADVTIEVNGSTPTNSPAPLSGDWYVLDITDDVAPATNNFRPLAIANEITILAPTGKQGQVTGLVEIRAYIQAI
jgi:hypothetical protein